MTRQTPHTRRRRNSKFVPRFHVLWAASVVLVLIPSLFRPNGFVHASSDFGLKGLTASSRSWTNMNSKLRRRRRHTTCRALTMRGGASVSPTSSDSERRSGGTLVAQPASDVKGSTNETHDAALSISKETSSRPDPSPLSPTATTTTDDTHNRRVLQLIRVLFLAYYGSLGSLMPYLPVYYHSLGHGGLIIGMLGAVKPLTTFLVAPFWGILSDKSDNRFHILYFTFAVSCVGQLLVAFRNDVWYLMGMVFVAAVFNAPVKSLIDSLVMDHLTDRRDYGRLRLWGQLGFGLGSSGVGMLLSRSKQNQLLREQAGTDHALPFDGGGTVILPVVDQVYKFWQNLTGYRLLFFSYAALSIPAWLCLKAFERLDDETERRQRVSDEGEQDATPAANKQADGARIKEGLRLLFQNGDAMLFFFLVFVVGISSGIIENFAYVRMREVGGSGKEMGLSRLVSSAAGAPMFWFSGPLTERLGADRVLALSLLSYVTRFFLYAIMRNPYHGLPAEALRGVTFAAFWSTGTIYAHRISPPGMGATMLMFLNAMYGGLGQSLGAIIGGKLQSKLGTVTTFVYSGIFDLCFVGFVVLYLHFRTDSSFRDPKPITPREESSVVEAVHVTDLVSPSENVEASRGEQQASRNVPATPRAPMPMSASAPQHTSVDVDQQGKDRTNAPRV